MMKKFLIALFLVFLFPAVGLGESRLGKCVSDGKVCFAPSASVFLTQVDLSTGAFSGGVSAGIGYGLRYQWDVISAGLAVYAESELAHEPRSIRASLVASFMEYVRIGIGFQTLEGEGTHAVIQFGLGADLIDRGSKD